MVNSKRNGKKRSRDESPKRKPHSGNFCIITDTEKTEKLYFRGINDEIKNREKGNVKVISTDTKNLVDKAIQHKSFDPQYSQVWIVFDRDKVPDFDEIVSKAERKSICVGWSNPCIEVWFYAYYDEMPSTSLTDSTSCCKKFNNLFQKKNGQEYVKSDKDIYKKLRNTGDEQAAIVRAENRYKHYKLDKKAKPSEMYACTTVHLLVKGILPE